MATKEQVPAQVAPGFLLWRHNASPSDKRPFDTTVDSSTAGDTPSPPVLILLFTWLFSKPGAASKYVSLYTSKGCDVLQISSKLSHFLWPPNSARFAEEIVKVLKSKFSGYNDIIVHAMSIGAYNYTTCFIQAQERADMRTYFFDKVRGIVFDSLTLGTLDHMVRGIATGLSQWGVVRLTAKSLANLYFFLTHKTTVEAFNDGVHFFKTKPACLPTLIFASRNDPMCDVNTLEEMIRDWKVKDSFHVTSQVWEKSGHCAHLIQHGAQYKQLLTSWLASLHLDLDLEGNNDATKLASKL